LQFVECFLQGRDGVGADQVGLDPVRLALKVENFFRNRAVGEIDASEFDHRRTGGAFADRKGRGLRRGRRTASGFRALSTSQPPTASVNSSGTPIRISR
jgi:hypothetical protein